MKFKKIYLFYGFIKYISAKIEIFNSDFSSVKCNLEGATLLKEENYNIACKGTNELPNFEWRNTDSETKAYAITLTGTTESKTNVHFIAWNIPVNINSINSSTDFTELNATIGLNSNNNKQYDGPCYNVQTDEPECLTFTIYSLRNNISELSVDADYYELMSYIISKSRSDLLVIDSSSVHAIALPKIISE